LSLRSRILLLILSASLLPMLPMLWGLLANRAETIARAQTQLSNRTEGIASELDNRISGTAQLLFGLSRVPLMGGADKAACSRFLADVLKEHPQYTGLLTITPSGQLHCDSLETGRILNLTDRSYFQRSLHARKLVLEPTIGRLTGKGVLQIAHPVRDAGGTLQYIFLASLNLDAFGQSVASTLPYAGMNFQIWNADASVILNYPSDGTRELKPDERERAFVLNGTSGALQTLGEGGAARIWTTAALPGLRDTGLRLSLTVPRDALVERENWQFRRALGVLLALTALFLVVAALLGEFGVRRQAARLVDAIARLDRGDFKQLIGAPYPKGEMGTMMLALDRMALSLEQQHIVIERNAMALQHKANTDDLTGLASRSLLADRLNQALIYAHRSGRVVGVVVLDLDRFKTVNDSLGHSQGDLLLQTVAQRLRACSRDGDTVARLGGDEFVLVLSDMAQESDLLPVVQDLLQALNEPIELQGQLFDVSVSLGLSAYPRDGDTAEELIRQADTAMYRAKEQGGNVVTVFTPDMDQLLMERLGMEAGLRHALELGEFRVHYQPIVNLSTGKISAAEALVRWQHPQRGLIPPVQFITIAEETGLIIPIGNWVLQQACLQAKAWQDLGLGSIAVAVNLSARQFNDPALEAAIDAALARANCSPGLLQLEITESMVIADAEQALQTMRRINAIGVQLSIDDFGTGYSSLSYLKRFPVNKLKIDRSFVNELEVDAHDRAIVDAILTLAHKLGLSAVAEGVETAGQLQLLTQLGCDEGQGYHFAKPCSGEAFAQLPLEYFKQSSL